MIVVPHRVEITERVAKDIAKMNRNTQRRIETKFGELAEDPFPSGVTKLAGENAYRVRVGDYRIVYTVDHGQLTVWIIRVMHRGEVYSRKGRRR
jgi:mRNA interferase RelE/StbE